LLMPIARKAQPTTATDAVAAPSIRPQLMGPVCQV
jgi:hypothetical protein